jgi:ABC-type antimicrobial peptide transport system permease subunit
MVMSKFASWSMLVTASSIVGSFGYYPSRRASQLDPIEALRTD